MTTAERQTKESEIINGFQQLSEENKLELMDFITWIIDTKPSPEELDTEFERRKAKLNSHEFMFQKLVKRLIWNHTSTTEVLRRDSFCKALQFTQMADSPEYCNALTTAAIYEAGRIDGIRTERARRNHKH